MTIFAGQRVTWFNGSGNGYSLKTPDGQVWLDRGARAGREGAFASGLPFNTPGVALPGAYYLRQWFKLRLPAVNIELVTRQVDIGPSGKSVVDFDAALAWTVFTHSGAVASVPWTAELIGPHLPASADYPTGYILNTRTGARAPIPETVGS